MGGGDCHAEKLTFLSVAVRSTVNTEICFLLLIVCCYFYYLIAFAVC